MFDILDGGDTFVGSSRCGVTVPLLPLGCFGSCRLGLLAPSTADLRPLSLSWLALLLVSSSALFLGCSLLGPSSGPLFLGLSRPRALLLGLSLVLLGCWAICMSSELLLAVQGLQQSVDRLAQVVSQLPSSAARPGSCSSDTVIGILRDGYEQAGLGDSKELLLRRWVEEGPPEVPEIVVEEAKNFMQGTENQKLDRIVQTFDRGFWATAACTTGTVYQSQVIRGSIVVGHWVILRSPYRVPFRVASFSDLCAFVDSNDKDTVCQGLESITDVEVFCCGAGIPVPPLWSPSKSD